MADVSYSSTNSSPSRHITVLDVYDLAASIKLDLEGIVKLYGQHSVQDLACKVSHPLNMIKDIYNKSAYYFNDRSFAGGISS